MSAEERPHTPSEDCWCRPRTVRVSAGDVAADLGQLDTTTVPSIERPDGRPGFTEQYAGAQLVEEDELRAAAIPAGELRLREGDQPLPTGDPDAPNIHELVMTDLANRMELGRKRYGQPLKPHNGRDPLRDAYEELLDGAAYLRQAMFERDGA